VQSGKIRIAIIRPLKKLIVKQGKQEEQLQEPDFTTLNKRTRVQRYHEHFGKMDDPQYARKALEKIRLYENNGIFVGEQNLINQTVLLPK